MFNEKYVKYIDTLIKSHTDIYFTDKENKIKNICNYILSNGKRLRPSIALDICKSISDGKKDMKYACLSIEYIHTSSLIIDDLPCMDNATSRRGKDCIHIKYGEAIAQMVGVILLSMSTDAISKSIKELNNKDDINKLYSFFIENFGHTLGINGATGGQLMDLEYTKKIELNPNTNQDLLDMIMKKTGTFFETSFLLGWIFGGGSDDNIDDIKELSKCFSLMYQILDDIEDIEEDLKLSPESISQNYAIVYGKDVAIKDYNAYYFRFCKKLSELRLESDFFDEVTTFMNYKIKKTHINLININILNN